MTETLFFNIHLNLRQIEKQFSHLRIALMTFRKEEYVHPGVLVLLEYFRNKHYDFYVKIRNRSYNIDELVAELENKFPHSIISRSADYDQSSSRFIWDVAKFLCCYCQDDKFRGESIKLITEGDNTELCFEVTTFNKETLSQMIKYNFDYKRSNGIYDICILIDHLELLYDLTEN